MTCPQYTCYGSTYSLWLYATYLLWLYLLAMALLTRYGSTYLLWLYLLAMALLTRYGSKSPNARYARLPAVGR